MFEYLQEHPVVLLFLIIALGFIIGRVKILGFSFDSSAILFVAMAFGHYGLTLNGDFQDMGLILFIYAIGLQAGPSIFNISRKVGMQLNLIVFFLLSVGGLLTIALSYLLEIDTKISAGIFAGALTSTPGLAAAQEATQSPLTSTGYGIAYPVGVIAVMIFLKLLPVLFKANISQEEEDEKTQSVQSVFLMGHKDLRITNPAINGTKLKKLKLIHSSGIVISRLVRNNEAIIPHADTKLYEGDIIRIVGNESALVSALPLFGEETSYDFTLDPSMATAKFIVTNKSIVGKTIAELNLTELYDVNITRIRRGGVDIEARANQTLRWGDRLRVVGSAGQMETIHKIIGNEMEKVQYGNIFSVIMGILLGISAGLIPFSIGKLISFNLGITGGVLVAGMFLSNRGKVGPVVWQVPAPITAFMRELGLVLFLAVVGVHAGGEVFDTLKTDGFKLILIGALITLLPMMIITVSARYFFKYKIIELIGIISGGMTSTPGLAVGTGMTSSQTPLLLYATVYPVAMILMMLWTKIIILF
jgi:putative transport protein